MTTVELSAVEVANLPTEGTFWIVREGEFVGWEPLPAIDDEAPTELRTCNPLPKPPPVVFTQACAPCECGGSRIDPLHRAVPDRQHLRRACPHCRIKLVGPCPDCNGRGWVVTAEDGDLYCRRTVTLGHAYAVGQPLPIMTVVAVEGVQGLWLRLADGRRLPVAEHDLDLAASAGGWYALELRRA